jgi:hypothetical protein
MAIIRFVWTKSNQPAERSHRGCKRMASLGTGDRRACTDNERDCGYPDHLSSARPAH